MVERNLTKRKKKKPTSQLTKKSVSESVKENEANTLDTKCQVMTEPFAGPELHVRQRYYVILPKK